VILSGEAVLIEEEGEALMQAATARRSRKACRTGTTW
jgi:hypothetical protein